MAQSTRGMAVLLLLCALSAPATATLGIFQSRVTYSPLRIQEFRVEGVATVAIGGIGSDVPDFFFDCNNTNNNGSGIQWSRVGGLEISTVPATSGLSLQLENVDYPDLDVYICTDTYSGESLELNITVSNPAVCPVREIATTLEGGQVKLEVYTSSFPLLTGNQLHWYRPNGNEIFSTEPNVQFANSRKSLILSNVQLADFGRYEVEGQLTFGSSVLKDRTGITLDIQVPPEIQTQPVNETTILERDPFSLSCTASGNPAPMIEWVREDGSDLNTMAMTSTQSNPSMPLSFVSSTLSIPFTLFSDSGRYRCSADNGISDPMFSDFSEITVRPTLLLTDSNNQPLSNTDVISQPDGSGFSVICHGFGNIIWTSSNGVIIPTNQNGTLYQMFDSYGNTVSLVFTSFSPNEVAVYTCESPLNDVNNVPITDSVLITNSDPAVFIATTVVYVLEGDSVSIEAGIYFSSASEVQWFMGGQLLNIASNPQLSQTIEGNVYTLNIANINSQLVGLYTVLVTRDGGQTASDNVTVSYASPPTVTVSETELTVTEGEEVRIQCLGEGVGVVRIRWYHGNEESVLQIGNDLVIPSVASTHTGQYECRVSNIAAAVTETVQITVKYMPFSMIRYKSVSSMSRPIISPIFWELTIAPVFMCTSDGYPEPTITWRATSETVFPNGVTTQAEGQELVWTRSFEHTDSMQYECVSENELGVSITTMDLLVQSEPRIDSVYSTQLSSPTSNSYQIPTGFTGIALTCLAFGWPPPYVQWLYNDDALLDGVDSLQTSLTGTHMGQVSAKLRFTAGFNSSFSGVYQCVVRENEFSNIPVTSEEWELIESGYGTSTAPPTTCSVTNSLVNFQIRILETDCISWGDSLKQSIANAFEDEIMRIIQLECNCTVTSDFVQTIELPTCSTMINNGVVFRGQIETNSVDQTENVFCALSNWQQSSPSVNINGQLFTVDSNCFIRVDSFSSPECLAVEPVSDLDPETLIIIIIGAVAGVVIVFLIICCVCCCCRRLKKNTWRPPKGERPDPYDRTDPRCDPRYGRSIHVGPIDETTGGPVYNTLERTTTSRSPLTDESPEHLALKQTGSLSRDFLIQNSSRDHESLDGDIHYLHTESAIDNPAISISGVSTSVRHFPYDSQPSSGSSSRVTSPPQRGPSRTVLSATNPIPDYEELNYNYKGNSTDPHFRFSSSGDSVTARKFSPASNSPSVTTGTGPHSASSLEKDDVFANVPNSRSGPMGSMPPISTAYLRNMTSRSSTDNGSASPAVSSRPSEIMDEIRRDSNCSEEPPPYSSRPPSGMTPASSMLDNISYGRVDPAPEDERWYMQASDASLDSNRHDSRRINGRIAEIQPYASIHNSAIPYEPNSIIRQQTEHRSFASTASPRFKVSVEHKRQHIPQPYSEPMLSQSSESGTPQPYSEAVPMRSSVGSLVSQGSFPPPSRSVTNFEITV